ncbi:MAG: hypothetical protein ACTSW1_15815 [Candidatus Hodarchaeales archaeon]
MQTNTIYTMIIGFLTGAVLYLTILELDALIMLITTGVGYVVGEILDTMEDKGQKDILSFSNMAINQEIYHIDGLPEALVIYSLEEERTIVRIDFRIDAKPQNFRLSVLKNLQNFQFRVVEDAQKTVFSLTLDFPDFNYPLALEDVSKKEEFHLAIKERALDFKTAITKIIPGLILVPVSNETFYKPKNPKDITMTPPFSESSNDKDNDNNLPDKNEKVPESNSEQIIDEQVIFKDLISTEVSKPQVEAITVKQEDPIATATQEDEKTRKNFLSENMIEELGNKQLLVVQDGTSDEEEVHEKESLSIDYSAVINTDIQENEQNDDFTTTWTDKLEEKIRKKKGSITSP